MISKVFISKVRSLESMDCHFDAGINVICGPNGCGKTTILEAVHLLAQGFSFRSRDLRELITWKNDELILRGEFNDDGRARTRALRVYARGNEARENGEPLKSPAQFFGTCPAVIMQPSDIELLRGGPEVRRHWLDEILCYRSQANAQVLRRYKRVLQQRNKWLKELKQNGSAVGGEDLFRVLTQQLIELGARLWAARIALSNEVSEIITRYYRKLSGGVDEITCAYKSSILKSLDALDAAEPMSDEMMDEIPSDAGTVMVAGGNVAESDSCVGIAAEKPVAYDAVKAATDDGVKALVNTIAVVTDLGLGGIQFQALLLDQVIHLADDFDVVGRVIPDVLLVALWSDDGELGLPVPQCGLGDAQNLRHVTDFVEFFVQFSHGLAQISRIDYLCLSAKIGCASEMLKYIWHFARLALPLQVVYNCAKVNK